MRNETIGTSPKAVAAAVAAALAPVVAGFVLDKLGVEVDVSTVAAVLGTLFVAVATFVSARLAKPGNVQRVPANRTDAGYSLVEVAFALLLVIIALVVLFQFIE